MPVKMQTDDHSDEFRMALATAIPNALEKIGLTAEAYAKLELSTPKEHGDKDKTVRPNVDTGRLRNSITHVVRESEQAVYIGTNVEYAPYVEMGTSRAREYPYLRPAATEHTDEYVRILRDELK